MNYPKPQTHRLTKSTSTIKPQITTYQFRQHMNFRLSLQICSLKYMMSEFLVKEQDPFYLGYKFNI